MFEYIYAIEELFILIFSTIRESNLFPFLLITFIFFLIATTKHILIYNKVENNKNIINTFVFDFYVIFLGLPFFCFLVYELYLFFEQGGYTSTPFFYGLVFSKYFMAYLGNLMKVFTFKLSLPSFIENKLKTKDFITNEEVFLINKYLYFLIYFIFFIITLPIKFILIAFLLDILNVNDGIEYALNLVIDVSYFKNLT